MDQGEHIRELELAVLNLMRAVNALAGGLEALKDEKESRQGIRGIVAYDSETALRDARRHLEYAVGLLSEKA